MQIEAGAPLITSPGTNDSSTEQSTRRPRLFVALFIVALPVYVADQLTKVWAAGNLAPNQPRELIGSVLQLNLTRNSGAAFSIGTGATWILTAIACSVVLFVVITARRLGSRGWTLALGLLLGGSLGNLTDRMFRAPGPGRGQVVDFLQLPHYPIFNIADSAIVSAAVLIAVMAFRGVGIDGTRGSSDHPKHHKSDAARHEAVEQPTPHEAVEQPTPHEAVEQQPRHEAVRQPPKQSSGTDHDV
jgi:signal peptidase II